MRHDGYINVHGDEPFVLPAALMPLVVALRDDEGIAVDTPQDLERAQLLLAATSG